LVDRIVNKDIELVLVRLFNHPVFGGRGIVGVKGEDNLGVRSELGGSNVNVVGTSGDGGCTRSI
jgi:hypothetical protein